ncbi:MAG: amino acid adenylation domain-containing protein [Actinomycetota bacterium]
MTPLQLGMLFHGLANPGKGVDIEHIAFDLHGTVDSERLVASWNAVIATDDVLRTRFEWQGTPERVIEADAPISATVLDWRAVDESTQNEQFHVLSREDRHRDFDLSVLPLQRLTLVQLADEHWRGLWSFHHILLDGRSFSLVLSAIFDHYDHGTPPPARPSFDDFVGALLGQDMSEAERFWKNALHGTEPTLPLSVGVDVAPTAAPFHGAIERRLSPEQTSAVRAGAEALGVTLNNLVQAAWTLLLHRYSARSDVVFGSTRACRHLTPDAAETVGLLINTVPFRVAVDRATSVRDFVAQVRAVHHGLRHAEAAPLAEMRNWAQLGSDADLFETLVMYDEATLDARMGGPGTGRTFTYTGQTNYPITLLAYGDPEMLLRIEYAYSHLTDEAAQATLDRMAEVLLGLVADGERAVGDVPYLTATDTATLARFNDTAVDYDLDQTLVDLFERQVAATPAAPAITFGGVTLTYAEFNARINQLAHTLRGRGVGREAVVGVYAHRSLEMLVAVHAIVKAGGAYLPLDPDHPTDRLTFCIEDTGASLVLTAGGTATSADRLGCEIIDLDQASSVPADAPTANPDPVAGPGDAAYVIFTSGSTGRPKGVLNEHRGIVNRLLWKQDAFGLGPDDVVLQKTPFTFDVSVWELFWPFQVGAQLVVAPPDAHRDPRALVAEITDHGVTTLHFVPSMLALFAEEPTIATCTSIRRIICSGEALARDLQDRTLAALDVEIHNLYGPTEAAIDVTWWACDPASPLDVVPIGAAIANTEMHVLDADLQITPPGLPGELFIGGVQVARGYLNRPELNAERFLVPGSSPHVAGRLYRTGDLGRFRADGNIEYLGRTDHQVKIRGLRIELGEIEAVLASHPAVSNCVVVDREDRPGDKKLVAYVVAPPTDDFEDSVRAHLAVSLADYMIPSAFVVLDDLPLTTSGKVDRKVLPAPSLGAAASTGDAPRTEVEEQVAAIWAELLEHDQFHRVMPFFDAGGNSLLVITLASRLGDAFDRQVSVTALIDASTVAAQADLVSSPDDSDATDALAAVAAARKNAAGKRRARRQRR